MTSWKMRTALLSVVPLLALTACSSSSSPAAGPSSSAGTASASSAGGATASGTSSSSAAALSGSLTIWNRGPIDDTTALKPLIDGFKKKYPTVTINAVAQPGDNYFAVLQAAVIGSKGPDIASMFPGGYQVQFQNKMLDLNKYIPKSELEAVGAQYYAQDGDLSKATYGVPVTSSFYGMFYNKKVLSAVGVTAFPTTWTELNTACAKVKAAGKTCLGYGSDSGSGGFPAFLDWSYLVGAVDDLKGWDAMLTGQKSYNSPEVAAQVTKWAALRTAGYTNDDVLTWRGVRAGFANGSVAMVMGGSWDTPGYEKALGTQVAVMPAPFADTPQKKLVRLPDNGYDVLKSTKNPQAAAAFEAYIISAEGQKVVAAAGQVPSRTGVLTTDPVNGALLKTAATPGWTAIPMFDNFTAPSVTDALTSGLNSVLAGKTSPSDVLGKLDSATKSLTSAQRVDYHLGS